MKTKIISSAILFMAAVAAVGWWLCHPAPSPVQAQNPPPVTSSAPAAAPENHQAASVEMAQVTPAEEKLSSVKPGKKTGAKKNSAAPKEPLQDPDARVALSLVGADPDAESYWLSAISDPSLPDKEREDLMEDLNEVGFADPKHPAADEIPLIQNRIALIEQILPDADPFMQEHLGEAYKDLNNMLAGQPVQ